MNILTPLLRVSIYGFSLSSSITTLSTSASVASSFIMANLGLDSQRVNRTSLYIQSLSSTEGLSSILSLKSISHLPVIFDSFSSTWKCLMYDLFSVQTSSPLWSTNDSQYCELFNYSGISSSFSNSIVQFSSGIKYLPPSIFFSNLKWKSSVQFCSTYQTKLSKDVDEAMLFFEPLLIPIVVFFLIKFKPPAWSS